MTRIDQDAPRDPAEGPLAVRRAAVDLPLCPEGRLAAAARLDALGVEVLQAIEAKGYAETSVQLVYRLRLEAPGAGGAVDAGFADLAALRDLAEARLGPATPPHGWRIIAVRCEAHLRDLPAAEAVARRP